MSWDTVASGAFHNQCAIPDGPSARPATSIHRFGLSIAKLTPMMAMVATQAARTSCFRWANVMHYGSDTPAEPLFITAHRAAAVG